MLLFTGCSSYSKRKNIANKVAKLGKLQPTTIQTSTFKIKAYYRFEDSKSPLTIYVEGDGFAYLNRNTPSSNPTPTNPLALRLAALDRSKNIVYLARPCQYVNLDKELNCNVSYWTEKRFANEVIKAINEAIDKVSIKSKMDQIHLVGYSGGGAVVALVAARRNDVASIRTVAGYMDHVSLNKKVGVSQLNGSLDPIRAAPRLNKIPQTHYSGRKDERIPGWVLINFRKAVGGGKCIKLKKVNASHEEGWEDLWETLWTKIPYCRK